MRQINVRSLSMSNVLKSLDTLLKGISYPNSAAAQGLTESEKLNVESKLLMVCLETAPSSESNSKGNFLHSFHKALRVM